MINGVVVRAKRAPRKAVHSAHALNILLTDLDRELRSGGTGLARHADDCNIYVRSRRPERVMESIKTFIEKKLKLKVNETKSAVDKPTKRKFLGFSMYKHKAPQDKISVPDQEETQEQTSRDDLPEPRISMQERIRIINGYLRGWIGYYALVETPSVFRDIEAWLRRRLRMWLMGAMEAIRTRYSKPVSRGLATGSAWKMATPVKDISISKWLNTALSNNYWGTTRSYQLNRTLPYASLRLNEPPGA